MKRFIVAILLVALIAPMMVFAADSELLDKLNPENNIKLNAVTEYRMPLTSRAKGMGGAGIAFPGRADSFFLNPAGFAKRIGIMLPSAEVTIYHPYDMLKPIDGVSGDSFVDLILEESKKSNPDYATIGLKALDLLESENSKLMEANASVAFDFAGFAFGLNVNDVVHTAGIGSGANIIDELNVTANIGFGLRFKLGDKMWIDTGANWRPTYRAYNAAIGAQELLEVMKPQEGDENKLVDKILSTQAVAAGYALPFDIGLNFSGSWWSVGIVGRNILGTYNMTTFNSLDAFKPEWTSVFGNKEFQIKTPWSIDAGFGLKWDNAFFKPTFVCDIVDINSMFTAEKFDMREFMNHLKMGAEIRLLSFLDVRGGLNKGYWTLGAGLDLAIVKVDIAYYWQEDGPRLGSKPVDALSVRVNVGFDR